MSSHKSKSTKRRKFLRNLEMLDYIEADQIETNSLILVKSIPSSSDSISLNIVELNSLSSLTNVSSYYNFNFKTWSDESDTVSLSSDSDTKLLLLIIILKAVIY